MNYVEKDFDEIFEIMLEDSVEKGLASKAENFKAFIANKEDISNYYVMDKAVIAKMFDIFYDDATLIYNSKNIHLATGIDLDNLGAERGIPRPPAKKASVKVTFTIDSEVTSDVYLDEGIIVSTDSGIQYETVEPLYIPFGSDSATIQCMSVQEGSHVKIIQNSIVNVVSNIPHHLTVTNPYASSGGADEYSDEDYRDLLLNWRKILIRGSLEAFDEYFASFDGIDSYKLIPNWNGTGTIKVILDPGDSEILNRAYSDLQNIVSQHNEDINMFAPNEKTIDIYAVVNVDIDQINPYSTVEKRNIKSKIITAIRVFIDGGYRNDGSYYTGLTIGEDFIPHKLAVFLDDEIPELKNISFNYPKDYILILDDEIGKSNNIRIEMV